MEKYAAVKNNDESSVWFKKCRENNIPYITLTARTKFADVTWDYITYPTEVDKVFEDLGDTLRDNAIDIFRRYANKKSKYTASGRVISFQDLEIEQAKLAASELHDLVAGAVASAGA